MHRPHKKFVFLVVLAGALLAGDLAALGGTLLGRLNVHGSRGADTMIVGRMRGAFSAIRVDTRDASAEVWRVVIHFDNGAFQVFDRNTRQRRTLRRGQIDLDQGPRFIERIEVQYQAQNTAGQGGEIRVYGVR